MSFGTQPFGAAASPFGFSAPASTPTAGTFGAAPGASGFGGIGGGFGAATQPGAFGGLGGTQQTGLGLGSQFGAATTSAFGQPPAATSPFGTLGAAKPPSTLGGFGTASTAGTGLFGQTATPTTGFGAPAQTGFGGGLGAMSSFQQQPFLGQQQAQPVGTGFGAATSGFGGGQLGAGTLGGSAFGGLGGAQTLGGQTLGGSQFGLSPYAQPNDGTGTKPYTPTGDKDTTVTPHASITIHSVSAMPEYRNKSHEELRWEDYQKGRKGPQQSATGFGGSTLGGFGQPTAQNMLGGFGAQPVQSTMGLGAAPFGSSFAQPNTGMPAFGSTGTTSAFGTSTGAFGSATTAPFGQQQTQSTLGAFGQPQQPAATQSFGAFGAQPTTGLGGFGTPQTGFGAQTSAFGQQSTSPFGVNTLGKPATTGFGGTTGFGATTSTFGAPQQQQGSVFGTPTGGQTASLFSTTSPGFGQQRPAQPQPQQQLAPLGGTNTFGSPLGSFGQAKPAATMTFGQPTSTFGSSFSSGNAFGTAPQAGSLMNNSFNMGSSLLPTSTPGFGGFSTLTPVAAQQPSLQATIDSSPYGNLPIFQTLNTPAATPAKPAETIAPGNAPLSVTVKATGSKTSGDSSVSSIPLSMQFPTSATKVTPRRPGVGRTPQAHALFQDLGQAGQPGGTRETLTPEIFAKAHSVKRLTIREETPATSARGASTAVDASAARPATSTANPAATQFARLLDASRVDDSSLSGLPSLQPTPTKSSSAANGHIELTLPPAAAPASSASAPSSAAASGTSKNALRLSDRGYKTSPSIEALQQLSKQQLTSVPQFRILCEGMGSIEFLEPVDLSDENDLCQSVIFKNKEVIVYPQEDRSVPVGKGLNHPAIVTLLHCYPIDAATGPVTDPTDARVVRKIRKMKEQPGTKFVDYEPATGAWKFCVEHFSRYGLDDDDDDDGDVTDLIAATAAAKAAVQNAAAGAPASVRQPAPGQSRRQPDQEVPSAADAPPSSFLRDEPVRVLGARRSAEVAEDDDLSADDVSPHANRFPPARKGPRLIDTDRTRQLMTLFEPLSPAPRFDASRAPRIASPAVPDVRMGDDDSMDSDALDDIGDPDEALMDAPVPPQPTMAARAKEPLALVPLESSLYTTVKASKHCLVDANLLMARSFRAGWSPNGQLVTIARARSASTVTITQLQPLAFDSVESGAALHTRFEESLVTVLDKTVVEDAASRMSDDMDDEPRSPVCRLDRLLAGALAAPVTRPLVGANAVQQHLVLEQRVWKLAAALFDPVPHPNARTGDLAASMTSNASFFGGASVNTAQARQELSTDMQRKHAVTKWLQEVIADERLTPENAPQRVLTLLSAYQVPEATEAAMMHKNFRLALVVAQGTGDAQFRAYMLEQLSAFAQGAVNKDYLTLYRLLAGDVGAVVDEHSTAAEQGVVFSWLRAFGLCLWYGTAREHPVADAVVQFDRLWRELATTGERTTVPKAEHLAAASTQTVLASERNLHVFFHMLRLHADGAALLAPALAPAAIGARPLDVRLPWLLYSFMRSNKLRDMTARGQSMRLHIAFAEQLLTMGMARWAVFVALHIDDDAQREHLARTILAQHEFSTADEDFLTRRLRVPQAWIAEGKAYRYLSLGRYLEASQQLVLAGLVEEAHEMFLEHVAPVLIAEERFADVVAFLGQLAQLDDVLPLTWHQGGQIYLMYAQARLDQAHLLPSYDARDLDESRHLRMSELRDNMLQVLRGLASLLPLAPTTLPHIVCRDEMAAKLLQAIDSVNRILHLDRTDLVDLAAIPLAEEQRLTLPHLAEFSLTRMFSA